MGKHCVWHNEKINSVKLFSNKFLIINCISDKLYCTYEFNKYSFNGSEEDHF
jgi:hypothetical protein